MATAKVRYDSPIKRKAWVSEGLIQKNAESFWGPFKGNDFSSIIMVQNDISAKAGHLVTFDFDGNLSGKAIRGKNTAKGKGEQKNKFSDSVKVTDFRYVVDNGTKFDGVDIGDLEITQHADSRKKLEDLWIRGEDQAYFDIAQQMAKFEITLDTATYEDILKVEEIIKTGTGYTKTPAGIIKRPPLRPFKTANGDSIWLWMLDVSAKRKLLANTGIQNLLAQADVRGNENRLIKGQIGKIGNFLFVEAPVFSGETDGKIIADGYYNFDNTGVEIPGFRKYDATNKVWSGQAKFDITKVTHSRSVILGAGAMQKGNGLMPDYKFETSDFDKFSESALEVWCGVKAVELEAENKDNADAKLAGYPWGLISVDIKI